MTTATEKLNDLYLTKMKEGDKEAVSSLRMLKSEVGNLAIDLKREVTQREFDGVLRSFIKTTKEEREAFNKQGRTERVELLDKRIEVASTMLPPQLTEADTEAQVKDAFEAYTKEHGKTPTVKELMPILIEHFGGTADNKVVNRSLMLLINLTKLEK